MGIVIGRAAQAAGGQGQGDVDWGLCALRAAGHGFGFGIFKNREETSLSARPQGR